MKFKITLLLSVLLGFIAIFTLSNCSNKEIDDAFETPVARAEDSYLETSYMIVDHTIGDSPCPQEGGTLRLYCNKDGGTCTADSAVITNPHPGLNATLGTSKSESVSFKSPDNVNSVSLNVEFNCNVAQSFKHKYTVVLYKDGVKVGEEELEVEVNVK